MAKVYSNTGSRIFHSEWSPEPVVLSSDVRSSTTIKSKNADANNTSKEGLKSGQEKPTTRWSDFSCGLTIGILCGGVILAVIVTYWLTLPAPKTYITLTTTSTTSTTTSMSAAIQTSCDYSCASQTWVSAINVLAQWSFDGTVNENTNNYLTSTNKTATYITGYINNALLLNATLNPLLSTIYIPLFNTSFTIDAWVYPTAYPNAIDHIIVAMCSSINNNTCLYITIRKNNTSGYLYFGFLNDDLWGVSPITLQKWTHVAFVFDHIMLQQSIYVNGFRDSARNVSNPLLVTSSNFTIGYNSTTYLTNESFEGYIDQLTVSNRAKSSCEILEQASVEAWFTFDNAFKPLMDIGPYSVSASASAYTIISGRSSSAAISLLGTKDSYFQASGFTALSKSNQPFSISLWIYPKSVLGTIVHISNFSNGTGGCYPLIGLIANSTVAVQIYNGNVLSLSGTNISLNSWSHIVQTWSPSNGLRLYVNNWNAASSSSMNSFIGLGTLPVYITLASSRSGAGSCMTGLINATMSFSGAIDDFRVYNRELSSADVCTIYNM